MSMLRTAVRTHPVTAGWLLALLVLAVVLAAAVGG